MKASEVKSWADNEKLALALEKVQEEINLPLLKELAGKLQPETHEITEAEFIELHKQRCGPHDVG